MLNIAEPYCYSLSSQSTISSKEFLQKAGELVSDYDTPFFSLESSVEVDFEESNRLIIKTNSNDPLTDYRGAVDKTEGWNSIHILQYQSKEDAQEALEFYSNQNYVDYVEEDKYVDIVSESDSDGIVSETPLSWGNNAVKSFSTNNLLLESNIDLADITVGIFDTGLNTNHDCFSDDRILEGYNVYDKNTNITDSKGHGSHVAGIIYNNTLSNVKLKMYKLNTSTFLSNKVAISLFASAIFSSVDDGIDVINMSLSLNFTSDYFYESLEYAYSNNVPVIVAAGNDYSGNGKNIDNAYLASQEIVITVAAVDKKLNPMLKSTNGSVSTNYGTCVDISAPGEDINSVNYLYGYMKLSGTSMAAPFVTAAIATLKSTNPLLSAGEAKNIIKASAYLPKNWDSSKYGSGVVDFEKMLSNLLTESPKIILGVDDITITSPSKTATIYYTVDGSTPVVGESLVYKSPINSDGVSVVKAKAIEEGKLASSVVSLFRNRQKNISVYYKSTEKLPVDLGENIDFCYVADENIVTYEGNGKIKAHSIGETQVVAFLSNNCRVTYNVTVEYAWWQWLIRIFLLGIFWY